MKAPNGYGTVVKLSGNRRRPWACRITVGWAGGRQKYKYVSYHEKRRDAIIALAEYNSSPYDLDAAGITFAEMYEKMASSELADAGASKKKAYAAAYAKMEPLYDMRFRDIKYDALQKCVDECNRGFQTRRVMKTVLRAMYSLAVKSEVVDKNLADLVDVGKREQKKEKRPFTEQEIDVLWDAGAELPLVLVYTGMRVGELLGMKQEDVHIEERYMVGGNKTKNGKKRKIPIHPRILPFIEKRLDGSEWLIPAIRGGGESMGSAMFDDHHWKPAMAAIGAEGVTSHYARVTFASRMDSLGVPLTVLQVIIGHSTKTVTDKYYIKKNVEELKMWVDKLR